MINERGQVATAKQEHYEAQAQGNRADGDVIPFFALRKSTLATPRIRNVHQRSWVALFSGNVSWEYPMLTVYVP